MKYNKIAWNEDHLKKLLHELDCYIKFFQYNSEMASIPRCCRNDPKSKLLIVISVSLGDNYFSSSFSYLLF